MISFPVFYYGWNVYGQGLHGRISRRAARQRVCYPVALHENGINRSSVKGKYWRGKEKMHHILLRLISKPILQWVAHKGLIGRNRDRDKPEKGRFTRAEVDRILKQGWRNFDQLAPDVPREPTVGNRLNMMLACLTIAFFRALLAAGIERGYAIELCADVAWKVYEKWGVLPGLIAKTLTRDPVKRMRMCVNMFLYFPFNPPGYVLTHLSTEDEIAFDVRRCPVAEYMKSGNAADLCAGSWCNLDYALAEMWGGWLERDGTLAAGDDRCRFRFKAAR